MNLKHRNFNVFILTGEKGVGKSTYSKNKWKKNIYIDYNNHLKGIKTFGGLYLGLEKVYHNITDDKEDLINNLHIALKEGYSIIIDNVESTSPELIELITNSIVYMGNSTLVLIFDLKKTKLLLESEIYRQLLDNDIIPANYNTDDYTAEFETLINFIDEFNLKLNDELKKEIINLSNKNFNNIKKIVTLINEKPYKIEELTEEIIDKYSICMVEDKMKNLDPEIKEILKKSSIIGDMFQKCVLESKDGFNCQGINEYLNKIEATNEFIQRYTSTEDIYMFISSEIYKGIKNSIDTKEAISLQKILINYYMLKISSEENEDELIKYLVKLKVLAYEVNDNNRKIFADKRLLILYIKNKDISKTMEVLNDLLKFCGNNSEYKELYHYLIYYKITLNIKIREFDDALIDIDKVMNSLKKSNLYLQYYNALALYGVGKIDESYEQVKEISKILKDTSNKPLDNQPIYALTYSLFATIQNHFGIDDLGNKYYTLALNNAKNKLEDQSIFYEILKKCDMYYDFQQSYKLLLDSIEYFENHGKQYKAAEIYVNIGTELIFNDAKNTEEAKRYLKKAVDYFSVTPNENLAYAQNNLAILKIITERDFVSALSLFEQSLFIKMSDFTYMTIYLNTCMCYLNISDSNSDKFKKAYDGFIKYYNMISHRKNPKQYEKIYKKLLDIIILERKNKNQEILQEINEIKLSELDQFFHPILKDIKSRVLKENITKGNYQKNKNLYQALDKYRIFLAEFRFWE